MDYRSNGQKFIIRRALVYAIDNPVELFKWANAIHSSAPCLSVNREIFGDECGMSYFVHTMGSHRRTITASGVDRIWKFAGLDISAIGIRQVWTQCRKYVDLFLV